MNIENSSEKFIQYIYAKHIDEYFYFNFEGKTEFNL